jgi:hypothetical protein
MTRARIGLPKDAALEPRGPLGMGNRLVDLLRSKTNAAGPLPGPIRDSGQHVPQLCIEQITWRSRPVLIWIKVIQFR